VEHDVIPPLNSLQLMFQGPFNLIRKRYDKLLDYENAANRLGNLKDSDLISTVSDPVTFDLISTVSDPLTVDLISTVSNSLTFDLITTISAPLTFDLSIMCHVCCSKGFKAIYFGFDFFFD